MARVIITKEHSIFPVLPLTVTAFQVDIFMMLVSGGIKRKNEEEGSVPFDLHAAITPRYSGILIERLACFSYAFTGLFCN